jgi:hypothetical protein
MSFRSYAAVALAVFIGLTAVHQIYVKAARLSCWSGGYALNAWMAYCNSDRYGVYDVDAIWFGAESDVKAALDNAQILTLSDSKLQNALSLGGASEWFLSHHLRAYFLGLPTAESGFGVLLWAKFKPHPRLLILDASPYFTGGMGKFEDSIIEDANNRQAQLADLKAFQEYHQAFCARIAWLCGQNFAYFRSRIDGHWLFQAADSRPLLGRASVPNDRTRLANDAIPNEAVPLYPDYLKAAQALISTIDLPRRCIVITHVPSEDSMQGLAQYLSESLGLTRIEPILPGLATFDRAHLTPSSSRQWSQAFLRDLEPVLRSCVAES